MPSIRWQKLTLAAAVTGGITAALTGHAAIVQQVDPSLAWAGGAIGVTLGAALATGHASLRFTGAVLGSLVSLQFFKCLPCDGSPFIMPIFGALVGGITGWTVQALRARWLSPVRHSPSYLT